MHNAIHLGHPSGLSQIDVSSHSIPAAPLMDDKEAKALDVGEARLVQSLHDQIDGLGGEVLGRSATSSMGAIATDHGGRMPTVVVSTWPKAQLVSRNRDSLPRRRGEKGIHHGGIHARILELLQKRGLVEGDACWQRLVDDPFALRREFGSESRARSIVS